MRPARHPHGRLWLGACLALQVAGCRSGSPVVDPDTHLRLASIPAGQFAMGSPVTEAGRSPDEPRHLVTLTRGFLIGVYEVTQDEWRRVMDTEPSHHAGCPRCPVERVNLLDVERFLQRINAQSHQFVYRLPTEAEWEYACRAGTTTAFPAGGTITTAQANFNGSHPAATVPGADYRGTTVPVGSFPPNRWGLFDMAGNVWEWTADWYAPYPADAAIDPTGPASGDTHVIRGGSWFFDETSARCAGRYTHAPADLGFSLGFRVAATRR